MTPSVPAVSGAPAPFWRRAFAWWLIQVKHVLPPTIFFCIGFNLILFTRWMTLQEHGIPFTNFSAARSPRCSLARRCSSITCDSCAV